MLARVGPRVHSPVAIQKRNQMGSVLLRIARSGIRRGHEGEAQHVGWRNHWLERPGVKLLDQRLAARVLMAGYDVRSGHGVRLT